MSTNISNPQDSPVNPEEAIASAEGTAQEVWESLRSVQDPELPVSVVDLGLIYGLKVSDNRVEIDITLTYSGCPAKDIITGDIKRAVYGVEGINEVEISVVYAPPWDYDRITDRGRRQLHDWGITIPGYDDAPDPSCHT